jgi:zinc transporter 1/2/3
MFKLLNTMGAIAAHKWAASLSIGISLSKTGLPDPPIYRLLALFSAATPFGILLGISISKAANEAVQGVFFSITVGTFLYIAASEVIVEEFAITRYKYTKFGSFLVGIVTISLLTLYDPD